MPNFLYVLLVLFLKSLVCFYIFNLLFYLFKDDFIDVLRISKTCIEIAKTHICKIKFWTFQRWCMLDFSGNHCNHFSFKKYCYLILNNPETKLLVCFSTTLYYQVWDLSRLCSIILLKYIIFYQKKMHLVRI